MNLGIHWVFSMGHLFMEGHVIFIYSFTLPVGSVLLGGHMEKVQAAQ